MAFSDSERQRIAHFRRRWAEENFQPGYNSSDHAPSPNFDDNHSSHADHNADLSEITAQQPARPESTEKKKQKRTWMENLRRASSARLADISAPPPATSTTSSSSLRTGPYSNGTPVNQSPDDDEEAATPSPDRDSETPKESPEPAKRQIPAWLNEIYILAWLAFFALLGTLARLGVEAITDYPDAPVTSRVLWANLGGSLVMGFFVEDRNLFGIPTNSTQAANEKGEDDEPDEQKISSTHLKHKKTIPLYVGLTTGFCGCFTSFSSFIRDVFLALTNDLVRPSSSTAYHSATSPPSPRNGGFSFLAACAILILHPAISLAALKTGAHLALLTRSLIPATSSSHPKSFILIRPSVVNILNPLAILLGFGGWLFGALFLTIFPPASGPSPVNWRARATIPLLFAPPGCFLRFYLAKYLNRPSTPHFPWGTFVANIFGTLVLGMAWDLQHAPGIGASRGLDVGSGNACAVLLGVQEGFCGCLTTVSTWVVELAGLGRRWAWWYGSASVAVGVAGMVIVMGGMGWTIGFANPLCG